MPDSGGDSVQEGPGYLPSASARKFLWCDRAVVLGVWIDRSTEAHEYVSPSTTTARAVVSQPWVPFVPCCVVAPSVDSWKKARRMNPKPRPLFRFRLAESGISLHARDERKIAFRFGVTGPYNCWGSGGCTLSSPDRLVALKYHPSLQRSRRKLIEKNAFAV